ncbi:MAG: CPBP family intramembrane glutamic endopeptidase [bacterium]
MENKKLFYVLLAASTFGLLCVYSYAFTLTNVSITPLMMYVFFPLQILFNMAFFAAVILIGLALSKKVGLGTPVLEKLLQGEKVENFKSIVKKSIFWGAISWLLINITESIFVVFCPELLNLAKTAPKPSALQGFFASFYGGISEEILLRLFLMTLLVWLFYKIKKSDLSVWFAILISAILFGLGHLPATAKIVPLTTCIVFRAIVLNGVVGIVYGWLYWKKGLLSAMIAHFTTDIIMHALLPLIASMFVK